MKASGWKISYRDSMSGGAWRSTFYYGEVSREFIIDFFGLDRADVYEYKLEQL